MFHPAVPITMDTVAGNTITLDVGSGQFAYYCHLQPGSLQVKPGDHVRRGQFLARVGASGDAREPHLHIEVTTDPHFVAGDGVPYPSIAIVWSAETTTSRLCAPTSCR